MKRDSITVAKVRDPVRVLAARLRLDEQRLLRDIFEWDVVNWSPALGFWARHLDGLWESAEALEIGARYGGLSLWLALNGARVVCSDVAEPVDSGRDMHKRYNVAGRIRYEMIDARSIPYRNKFDIVTFKSVLGGVRGRCGDQAQDDIIASIHRALKPGGVLLFIENLDGCALHRVLRQRFVKWGSTWKYLRVDEVEPLLARFASLDWITSGFAGCFGRSEGQRRVLGNLDRFLLTRFVPRSWHYVFIGVATR